MAASLLPWVKPQFCDAEGVPVAGGQLYSFVAGTETPQATYSDPDRLIANANPILLNAGGWSGTSIYLLATGYKFRLLTADDVPLWTVDNVLVADIGEADTGETGDWIEIPFDAANFTSESGGTFLPTMVTNRYRLIGDNAVIWIFTSSTMTLSGTLGARLRMLNLPFHLATATQHSAFLMTGAYNPGGGYLSTSSAATNAIDVLALDGSSWTASYSGNAISFIAVLQVTPASS